ncbi:MAG: hypothetical protein M5U08_13840 [Burkholderiales bacterium]|nr:hypothetical protein [Burkholderiales bacterium]
MRDLGDRLPWAGEPDRDQDAIDAAGRAFRPYPEMTIKSVCEFARREIAPKLPAKVSVWLWVTNSSWCAATQHVIAALGFEPEAACTMLTWDKVKSRPRQEAARADRARDPAPRAASR